MNVFGITTQNMLTVQASLAKYAKNMICLDINQHSINHKRVKKADLILVANIRTYNTVLLSANKTTAPIIIFDSPFILCKRDINLLDQDHKQDVLNLPFTTKSIDYKPVILALKKPQQNKLERINRDVLTEIIKSYSAGGFLDKFNTYIYHATTLRNKPAVRSAIVQYVFGKQTKVQMIATINKNNAKNSAESQSLLQQIIDFMESVAGINLQKALLKAVEMENAASKNARRTVSYKKITDEFNVDKFELKNLVILFRKTK